MFVLFKSCHILREVELQQTWSNYWYFRPSIFLKRRRCHSAAVCFRFPTEQRKPQDGPAAGLGKPNKPLPRLCGRISVSWCCMRDRGSIETLRVLLEPIDFVLLEVSPLRWSGVLVSSWNWLWRLGLCTWHPESQTWEYQLMQMLVDLVEGVMERSWSGSSKLLAVRKELKTAMNCRIRAISAAQEPFYLSGYHLFQSPGIITWKRTFY